MKKIIYYLILLIAAVGTYGVFGLVKTEMATGNGCPDLFPNVPACYVIYACFILIIIGHLFKNRFSSILYFSGAGIALAIASYASWGQYFGQLECPKTTSGDPMCYYSFAFFLSLILLKTIEHRLAFAKK